MKRKLACVAVLGLVSAGLLVAQDTPPAAAKIQVEPVEIQVARPKAVKDHGLSLFGQKGTSLKLLIVLPGKNIIATDTAGCKLTTFADDKGTDLSKTRGWGSRPGWLESSSPPISKDGQACIMELRSDAAPAKGAGKIILKAKLALKCGSGEKTHTEKVAMKAGTLIKFPPAPMKVGLVRDGDWGGMKMTFTVTSDKSTESIKKVALLGPDGKEIKHRQLASGQSSFMGKTTYETTYGLVEKADPLSVKITYYTKMESVAVPVDISVGVGL